jgi:rhamnose utilization protein RhaD (predicted bifunctional aldolase and dehydrogenase)
MTDHASRAHADATEWQQFCAASARIGRDMHLVQGAGGNVSLKSDGLMRIKASGRWLSEADSGDIFVPLDLDEARRRVAAGSEDYAACLLEGAQMRPSIETGMHAALPHRVVLHVHSVNVLAHATRERGEQRLAQRLAAFRWAWIPYCRPGAPLTNAILQRIDASSIEPIALVLANHGLVVAADSIAAALALLGALETALESPPRPVANAEPPAHGPSVAQAIGARPSGDRMIDTLALDATSLAIAAKGALYPDHVVFLGAVPAIRDQSGLQGFRWDDDPTAPYVIVPQLGVLLRPDISANATAMLACWAMLASRLPGADGIVALPEQAIRDLTGWDAEKYRQSLERQTIH